MSKLVLLECRIQQLSERLPAGFDVALRILERFIYIDKKKVEAPYTTRKTFTGIGKQCLGVGMLHIHLINVY